MSNNFIRSTTACCHTRGTHASVSGLNLVQVRASPPSSPRVCAGFESRDTETSAGAGAQRQGAVPSDSAPPRFARHNRRAILGISPPRHYTTRIALRFLLSCSVAFVFFSIRLVRLRSPTSRASFQKSKESRQRDKEEARVAASPSNSPPSWDLLISVHGARPTPQRRGGQVPL
jgi:hypothetical protein